MPLLELDGLSKTYWRGGRHRVDVLRDVSMTVEAGRFVSVVGDPMSGKTTLLRIAAGLERPDAGTVRLAGEQLVASGELDSRVAMVTSSSPPHEISSFEMLDFVAMPVFDPIGVKKAHRRAIEVLKLFNLAELQRAQWHELSDVERALMRIAQATVRRAPVLLIDDPVHGLSISHVEAVLAQLRTTVVEHGMGLLMTVSELSAGLRCDEVWQLSAGMLVDGGSRETGQVLDFRAGRGGA